jgi:hypothetical protein
MKKRKEKKKKKIIYLLPGGPKARWSGLFSPALA